MHMHMHMYMQNALSLWINLLILN